VSPRRASRAPTRPLSLAPGPVTATTAVPAPTVHAEGGTLELVPDPVQLVLTIPTPAIASVIGLVPGPVVATLDIPAPVLGLLLALSPAPVAATTAVPAPAVGGPPAVIGLAARMGLAYADRRIHVSAPPESRVVGARRL
jgi:hypothetical protein